MRMTRERTKRILRTVLLLAGIASLAFVPWSLVRLWIMPLPATVQEQMDEAIAQGFDGMIVYVDQAGKPPEQYAAGWHDREKKIPAYPQALFKIASISKLYVAVATAKLVSAHRLDLDRTLADHFPELVGRIAHADRITLRMMVQHRSGIPDYTDQDSFWEEWPEHSRPKLHYALDLPADFEPGTDYGYSNTNYLLLRRLIDRVLGYSHHAYIKAEILEPLGLDHTFASLEGVDLDEVMGGYHVGIEEDLKGNPDGMLATAQDVGIFLRALNDGSVFKGDEQAIYSSIYVYEHTGLVPGYQSMAEYHPDINTVIVQFNNTTDFEGYEWNEAEIILGRIERIVRERKEG